MSNKKVTELPTNTNPAGSEVYGVEGGNDYRIPVGGPDGIAVLNSASRIPSPNLGSGTADGTTYLRGDGVWAPIAAGGSGTVTNVAASGSTGLTVGGSPITTSGTLTFVLSANLQSWSGIAPSSKANTGHTHPVSDLTATGTRDATTFLRGDNTWAVPPGGGGGGSGTVTSIDVSGGTTGVTFSGGPVTSSGVVTMAGTLAIANGGTGASSATAARNNLGAAAASHTHPASDIVSGVMATARLGTGTADSTTFLRGDGTWASVPAGGSGTVTSVTISGGTGITVGGTNPITTSGTISLTLSSTLQSWSTIDPSTKANTAHTHIISDVTGLQGALDAKANSANPTFTGTVTMPVGNITGDGSYLRFSAPLRSYSATRDQKAAADLSVWVDVPRIFVQSGDPGAAAADSDIWMW